MTWLVLGVLLWSVVHLLPSVGAPARARAVEWLGQAYQGVFALAILASIVGSLIPARIAARVWPVEALRYE